MMRTDQHPDSTATGPAPIGVVARAVGLWGGAAALVAIAVAITQGTAVSAAMGIVTATASAMAGFGLLHSLAPRPKAAWIFPMMASQMVRTMLAPAIGLAVALSGIVEPMAFWMTVLAVACSMLIGETIAIAGLGGSSSRARRISVAEGADR